MDRKTTVCFVLCVVLVSGLCLALAGCGGEGAGVLGPGASSGTEVASPAPAGDGQGAKDASAASADAGGPAKVEPATAEKIPEASDDIIPEAMKAKNLVRRERIIDQDEAGKAGPGQYWHREGGYGWDGDMHWTYVNGNSDCNYMVWHSGLSARTCEVQVFIPRNHATTTNARYCVEYFTPDGQWHAINWVSVNQAAIFDQWVSLGTYSFAGEPAVFLGDATGESYSTRRKVGFDGAKFLWYEDDGIAPPPPTNNQVSTTLSRAHAQLGRNPYGKYYCLKHVRNWTGLPAKWASATLAEKNYRNKRVFHAGGSPGDAPAGAWLFYSWSPYGHVGMRDTDSVMIHQDNSSAGRGRVAHSNGSIGLRYNGYVTLADAIRCW